MLNQLRRSMQGCSYQAKARAYTALVHPHLETSVPVWTPAQDDLEKVQRRAARWICVKWDKVRRCWSKTYEECWTQLRWPTVQQRIQLLSCCQTFKIIHNLDCLNFDDYLCFNQSSTRSHNLTLHCAKSRIRYSFFVNIPFLWNSITYDIVKYFVCCL